MNHRESTRKPIIIDIYVDYAVRRHYVEPDIFSHIERLGVRKQQFIALYKKEIVGFEYDRDFILRFGLKYNWVFNKHLKRPENYPTWQRFLHEMLTTSIEKYRYAAEKEAGFDLEDYVPVIPK